jgi:mannose-6-phosphate isomerase-like protein (cupin superfamily)
MTESTRYDIHLDNKYGYSRLIDIDAEVAACNVPWFNQTLTAVNDSVVRLGIFHGEFHWHKHDREDEFFMTLEGEMLLDIENQGTVTLGPRQGYTVPAGVVHRTRAPQRAVVLMIEKAGVQPTGD